MQVVLALLIFITCSHVHAYPTVVVSSSATVTEQYAAAQLKSYLGNMSNMLHGMPIPSGNDSVIAVGYDAAIKTGTDH